MEPIIKAKGIGKKYNINHHKGGYIALRDILTNVFKNPFSFLKEKSKQIFGIDTKEEFWALKDVNFEIMRGEVVGIIGKNGAGKSTLLKILSQITPPTTGEIRINGTVGSLLEVGTGFHPELTGRENIFLNGAILGMKKREIVNKFDAIVAFAGVEKFLDTPVKYYSSGMYVRLAFSVAAHMDTDVLIIDEVLAVGDAEFQNKCLKKMKEITEEERRTILFVSHNMEAVRELCSKTILLEAGRINTIDTTSKVLHIYGKTNNNIQETTIPITLSPKNTNKELIFNTTWIELDGGHITNIIDHDKNFSIHLGFEVQKDLGPIEITLSIKNSHGINIIATSLSDSLDGKMHSFEKGMYTTSIKMHGNLLIPDIYSIRAYAHEKGIRDITVCEDILQFKIVDAGSIMKSYGEASTRWACVFSNARWNIHTE